VAPDGIPSISTLLFVSLPQLIEKGSRSFWFSALLSSVALAGRSFPGGSPCAHAEDQDGKPRQNSLIGKTCKAISRCRDRTDPNGKSLGLALNRRRFLGSDNGTGLSTLYRPDGSIVSLVGLFANFGGSELRFTSATGIVFKTFAPRSPTPPVVYGKPAAFIFDGEDGSITCLNGIEPNTQAVIDR